MSAPRKKFESTEDIEGELVYRFPLSCINLELLPDTAISFGVQPLGVRLNWQKGKNVFSYIETTPLRPIAEATLGGQSFTLFLTNHEKKGQGKVRLWGERNGAKITADIEGRNDQLTWTWTLDSKVPVDSFTLHLPFAPGGTQVIQAPDSNQGVALWRSGVAITVALLSEGVLRVGERGLALFEKGARTLSWELRVAPARTESDVRNLLVTHLAELGDRRQEHTAVEANDLFGPMRLALAQLTSAERLEKPAMDRLHYKEYGRIIAGEGTDAARAAVALLGHYYLNGDDALRRQARLLAHGLCDFQVAEVESPHWGAFWDAMTPERRFEDCHSEQTVSVVSAARASHGLHVLNTHFDTELMVRGAQAAAQWLLLKTDINGLPLAERFHIGGPRIPGGSPWAAGDTMIALVETFRSAKNETYLKAALRSIGALRSRVADGNLRQESAPTEYLAACIEGILLVSREYENNDMLAFARQLGATLRARRQPDGWVSELPDRTPATPLSPALSAARAALALMRIDEDPVWPLMALRALRAAGRRAEGDYENLPMADLSGLASLPIGLLLTLGARPKGGEADRDRVHIKRGWQTFEADPATREFIRVTTPDGGPVDFLALACQASLQVKIVVLAPPSVTEVVITKNQRNPFVRNLLTGLHEQRYPLEPLGDGTEARYGVFIADT